MSWKSFVIALIIILVIEIPMFLLGIRHNPVVSVIFASSVVLLSWSLKFFTLYYILEEECDPVKFLKKSSSLTSGPLLTYFQNLDNINVSVALITLGRFQEALEILTQKVNLSDKAGKDFKIAYHLALLCCHIGIGDLDSAGSECENLKELSKKTNSGKYIFAIDFSLAEYQYRRNESAEAARIFLEQIEQLLNAYSKKASKRFKLEILYSKAEMLEILGDYNGAAENYRTVAENGNTILHAEISRRKLKELLSLSK